jgi:hypothetical protein
VPNLSRPDSSGGDQIDADHQPTDLAVRPWRVLAAAAPSGPVPWSDIGGGGGRFCCRLSSVAVPWGPHDPAAVAGVPQRRPPTGCRVHQPRPLSTSPDRRVSAGCADLARNPSRCPRNRTPRQCLWCGRVLAGRLLSTADTAAALSRAGTPRPPVADQPCTPADCGSGQRPSPAHTARVSEVRAELRPPGDAVRTVGRWPRSGCPVGGGTGRCKRPVSTAASGTAAGVWTPGVRPGPCRSLRVSPTTGTGRLPGGRWRGAATAGRRG